MTLRATPSYRLDSRPALEYRKLFAALPLLVLLAALQTTGWAQQSYQQDASLDPPGRVARLNLAEGAVSFAPAEAAGYTDGNGWTPALLNRPLTSGDRLWTGPRARSELHIGSSALRMNEETSLDFLALDDSISQLRLAQGTVQLRVRILFEGQRLEIDTPNLAFVISQPGDYRLDVNPASDTTRVVAQSGSGTIYGDNGVSLPLGSQQQATFNGTRLAPAVPGAAMADSFDLWAADRDRREDQSVSARYIPRETIGYQQLDSYGDWQQDPAYGAVWLPRTVPANWAPYRAGHWDWISPWGWTWVDDAPWGFAPFHYGRWAQIGPRWAWVPGQLPARPVYAPALVAFVGGNNWNLAIGTGSAPRPALGWFPLAPGEAFRPAYRASPRYVSQVNNNTIVNNTVNVTNIYRYQHQPAAVTAASRDDFAHGRWKPGNAQALSAADLSRAQVLATQSAMPQRQERPELRERPRPAPAALPPPGVAAQAVVRSQGERGNDRRPFSNLPNRENERPIDPRASRFENSDHTPRRQLPAPIALVPPAPAVQPPAVRLLPAPAPERSTPETEQRVRREQLRQQSELTRQQDTQRLQGEAALGQQQRAMREQAQKQQELARQQAQEQQLQHDQQRRQAEEALGQQRLLREQAQRQQAQAQEQQQQRRQNELLRDQRPGNGGTPAAAPDARATAERNAAEQAQRAQQQQQQRQQAELIRQQDQLRRQNEEAMSQQQQRAMREQAQQQRASQQESPRQAQELHKQPPDQRGQPGQERQQTRPADAGHLRPPRPEGESQRKQEP